LDQIREKEVSLSFEIATKRLREQFSMMWKKSSIRFSVVTPVWHSGFAASDLATKGEV
jgi:hypothetical protein